MPTDPPSTADVVIVGGGIIGCAIAQQLATRGVEVVVCEARRAGGLQSPRALGFVWLQARNPRALPLAVMAAELWPGLSDELGTDLEWTPSGGLSLAGSATELSELDTWHRMAAQHGVEARLLDSTEVAATIPSLSPGWAGALHTPGGGHAQPSIVARAYADAAIRAGARVVEGCAVEALALDAGRVVGVVTASGRVAAPTVICAAGAWSSRVARSVGLRLPTVVVRAMALETAPAPPLTELAVSCGALAFRQRPGGSLVVSYVNQSVHDISLDALRYAREFLPSYRKNRELLRVQLNGALPRDIWRSLPGSPARVAGIDGRRLVSPRPDRKVTTATMRRFAEIVATRPVPSIATDWGEPVEVTPDELPVLGRSPREGLLFAAGFSGHGFALAPAIGRIMSDLVAGGETSIDIEPLRFARFLERDYAYAGESY